MHSAESSAKRNARAFFFLATLACFFCFLFLRGVFRTAGSRPHYACVGSFQLVPPQSSSSPKSRSKRGTLSSPRKSGFHARCSGGEGLGSSQRFWHEIAAPGGNARFSHAEVCAAASSRSLREEARRSVLFLSSLLGFPSEESPAPATGESSVELDSFYRGSAHAPRIGADATWRLLSTLCLRCIDG